MHLSVPDKHEEQPRGLSDLPLKTLMSTIPSCATMEAMMIRISDRQLSAVSLD